MNPLLEPFLSEKEGWLPRMDSNHEIASKGRF